MDEKIEKHIKEVKFEIDELYFRLSVQEAVLRRLKEIRQEFLSKPPIVTEPAPTPDPIPTPKIKKKRLTKRTIWESSGRKYIRQCRNSQNEMKYTVNISVKDGDKHTVKYVGTFDTIDEAVEARDKAFAQEMNGRTTEEKTKDVPSNRGISEYGWECTRCGRKYDIRLKPVICESCYKNEFIEQKP